MQKWENGSGLNFGNGSHWSKDAAFLSCLVGNTKSDKKEVTFHAAKLRCLEQNYKQANNKNPEGGEIESRRRKKRRKRKEEEERGAEEEEGEEQQQLHAHRI